MPFVLTSRVNIPENKVQDYISILLAVHSGALLIGSPLFGWMADNYNSRRGPLLIGILAMAISVAMIMFARNVSIMIAARVLQGFSSAIVWSVGMALIVDTAEKTDIGYVMGYVGIALSLGLLIGPILGGIVYERAGYIPAMAMAVGLLGLDIVLRLVMIERKYVDEQTRGNGDMDGGDSSMQSEKERLGPTIAVAQDVPATENSGKDTPTPSEVSAVIQFHFTINGCRFNVPPFITLIGSRRLLVALWGTMIQSAFIAGFDTTLPIFVQKTFGWDSLGACLVFLPIAIPCFLGPAFGIASDKYGPRWVAASGFLFDVPMLVLLRLVINNSISQKVLLSALLFGIGTAIKLLDIPLMAEIMHCVDAKEAEFPGVFGQKNPYAQAYGLFNVAFAAGGLVGPFWAGLLNSQHGWGSMTFSLAVVSGFSCIPIILWTGGNLMGGKLKNEDHE
ncbi:hypothetical protein BP6252_06512 [Coleophoma cylindrospora]|uniref:Major facilitator superfamily (MFS) profile domain-containing protein n=1 Tax=Coleophoma cylindrospora TaxID=1849047 RepID=A0A3D8RN51_9HELO|nr:hypothetical protein BP6252_06512 [Coleophoma cylindrospora]